MSRLDRVILRIYMEKKKSDLCFIFLIKGHPLRLNKVWEYELKFPNDTVFQMYHLAIFTKATK